MSDQLVQNFSELNVHSCASVPERSCQNYNGEENQKSNPWKRISVVETPSLEADAWPQPSVPGDHRRSNSLRQPDEKPKRKIKWQNFDVDQSNFIRGRGRGRGSFSHAPNTHYFRRGNFRGRLDNGRIRSGPGYVPWHYGNRMPVGRPLLDSKLSNFEHMEKNDASGDGSNYGNAVMNKNNVIFSQSMTSNSLSTDVAKELNCTNNSENGDSNQKLSGGPSAYEAGPVGRARRSYIRQHHIDPVATSQFQSVLPIQQPVAYVLPTVPVVGQAIWGTTVPVNPSTKPHLVTLPDSTLPATSQSAMAPMIPSFIADLDSAVSPANEQPRSSVNAEMVDVDQIITLINKEGWENTSFPAILKQHPAVSSIIRAISEVNHTTPPILEGDLPADDHSKPEDVIIVNKHYFFVPRNSNRTKFIKFSSKLDYIQHHIEHYFGYTNLMRDAHLASILQNNAGACPIAVLLQFNRLKWVSTSESELTDAVMRSDVVEMAYNDGIAMGIRPKQRPSFNDNIDSSSSVSPPSFVNRLSQSHHSNLTTSVHSFEQPDGASPVASSSITQLIPQSTNSLQNNLHPRPDAPATPSAMTQTDQNFPSNENGYIFPSAGQQLVYQSLYPAQAATFLTSLPNQNYIPAQPVSVLPTTDPSNPIMPALCRIISPVNPTPTVGHQVQYNAQANPPFLFQLLPNAQRTHPMCCIPVPPAAGSFPTQPIPSANGLWIPSLPIFPLQSCNPATNLVKSGAHAFKPSITYVDPTMVFQHPSNQIPSVSKNSAQPVPLTSSETVPLIPNMQSSNEIPLNSGPHQ